MHYSDLQLEKMIQQDDPQVLSSVPLNHLESCAECQQRLARLSGDQWMDSQSIESVRQALLNEVEVAGEEEFWQDSSLQDSLLKSSLAGEAGHFSCANSITVSVGPSGDWSEEAEHRERLPKVNTDFLEPAIHPELLGRLGRYDVESLVGVGGFGIVFKAVDTELRRVVALKVLAPHLMSSVAARKRFAREAQTAAAIVHEHVIPIYDVVGNDKHCYLVMQFIAGHSLQDRVDREGPLSIEDVLRIGLQIAGGLDAAHQQGVVHRDVKPANILMEESVDRVLISDFGLARTADDANLTRSGVITGTPHYMSPEQASGSLVDDRSDLFSLGSVMYFMCTGRPPFRAPQIVAVLNRICNHAHRPVSQIQPQIPAPVSDLIDRLLSKDPAKRFKSAAAAKAAIGQLLADFQSGKLAAEIREVEKVRRWKKLTKSVAKTVGVIAASALLSWGAAMIVRPWLNQPTLPGVVSSSDQVDSSNLASVGDRELTPGISARTLVDEDSVDRSATHSGIEYLVAEQLANTGSIGDESARQFRRTAKINSGSFAAGGGFGGGGFHVSGGGSGGGIATSTWSSRTHLGSRYGSGIPFRFPPGDSSAVSTATIPFQTEVELWDMELRAADQQLNQMEVWMRNFELEFLILEQEEKAKPSEK